MGSLGCNMKIEVDFDESLFRHQQAYRFDNIWNNYRKSTENKFIWGLILLAFGIMLVLGKAMFGYIICGISLSRLFDSWSNWNTYKTKKKVQEELTNKYILKYIDYKQIYELTDESFNFTTPGYYQKIDWSEFTDYKLEENQIIIDIENYKDYAIIDRQEVGDDNFELIKEIVKARIIL